MPANTSSMPAPAPGGPPGGPPSWWNTPPSWLTLVPRRRPFARRLFLGLFILLFLLSVIMNVYLLPLVAVQFRGTLDKTVVQAGQEDQTIAVYNVEGMIDGRAVDRFAVFCREVGKDRNVRAVLLRVTSPGGSVSASDQIHSMVRQLKEKGKKVVVSMGGVAASGGYYISADADEILAEPTTITGSIGVLAGWITLKGTLEKIGAELIVLKSSHAMGWKDEGLFKPDERQTRHLQALLDSLQERFEKVVKDARGTKLKPRTVSYPLPASYPWASTQGAEPRMVQHTETEPFNGKTYLADEALTLGLVDGIGYQSKAIDRAAELAGLSHPNVVRYETRRGLLAELLRSEQSGGLTLDRNTLEELQTPHLMMIWKGD